MTKKLYWDDSYIREFDASITAIDGNKVTLDRTAFNPRGGGLVGDTGTLENVKVVDTVKSENDSIVHILDPPLAMPSTATVHGVLDWDRRYRIMRMHTSAHLLSAIFLKETGALITGNQIEPEKSRIDFSLENFDRERMLSHCAQANEAISKNPAVKTYFMKREEALKIPAIIKLAQAAPPNVAELRIVEIEGIDTQADGGPHIKALGEIGNIEPLKFENKGKSNRRLYFTIH